MAVTYSQGPERPTRACPDCGAWWLPGAQQCPAHRGAQDAPPVLPESTEEIYPLPTKWHEVTDR
jgi:hypothetical protein